MKFPILISREKEEYHNPKLGFSVYLMNNHTKENSLKQKMEDRNFADDFWDLKCKAFNMAEEELKSYLQIYEDGLFIRTLEQTKQRYQISNEDISLIKRIRDPDEYPEFADELSLFLRAGIGLSLHSKDTGAHEIAIMRYFCLVLMDILPTVFTDFHENWSDFMRLETNFDLPQFAPVSFIRYKVLTYCQRINAPQDLSHYAALDHSTQMGDPHIEIDAQGYHFVVCERGTEFERRTTKDLDEIIYWIMMGIIQSMASSYAAEHRIPNQSHFRVLHQKELELFELVNLEYFQKRKKEIEEVLREQTYEDDIDG